MSARIAIAGAAAILSLTAQEPARQPRPGLPPSVSASGTASLSVKPDEVRISIGVVTQETTAEAAAAKNATQTSAVLAELRRIAGPSGDIRTENYSLAPQYRYPSQGGTPEITGYQASNTVEVRTRDLANLGKLIDAAAHTGANMVHSIQFTLHDEETARVQALRGASQNARAQAQAIAAALGLKLGRLLQATTSETPIVRPMFAQAMMAKAQAAPTPIESGNIDVRASVTVTYEVTQ